MQAPEIASEWEYVDSFNRDRQGYWLFKRESMGQTRYHIFLSIGYLTSRDDKEAIKEFRNYEKEGERNR